MSGDRDPTCRALVLVGLGNDLSLKWVVIGCGFVEGSEQFKAVQDIEEADR
jgi:hypothetical protein